MKSDNLLEQLVEQFSNDKSVYLRRPYVKTNADLNLKKIEANLTIRKAATLYLAPQEKLHTIEDLNEWMQKIPGNIEPDDILRFGYQPDCRLNGDPGYFHIAGLWFKQELGVVKDETVTTRHILITNDSEAAKQKIQAGKEFVTKHTNEKRVEYLMEVKVNLLFSKRFMRDYFDESARWDWANESTHARTKKGKTVDVKVFYSHLLANYGIRAPVLST